MTAKVPTGVGWTSLMTAYARAQEGRRPAPLVVDPWSDVLIEAATARSVAEGVPEFGARNGQTAGMWSAYAAGFVGRTPFFDRCVTTAVADGARQVVLLAAGLDARAARLDLPAGVRVFEIDHADVLEFKATTLARHGLDVARRVPVVADLAGDWAPALRAAGFRTDVATVWLAEGLLMYLDAAGCDRLVGVVRSQSAPGSRVAVEYMSRNPGAAELGATGARQDRAQEQLDTLYATGPRRPAREWLVGLGARPREVTDTGEELRRHGREVPPLFDTRRGDAAMTIWLASADLDGGGPTEGG